MSSLPSTPKISVLIPVHNGAKWLGETLQSIYKQTEPDFEVIMIDDASTDTLQDVLDQNQDERLQVVHLPKNVGVSQARNLGIELARGQFIAFCDADDICTPQRLEAQRQFLEQNPDIGFCGSAFTCFDTGDKETVSHPQSPLSIRQGLMTGNCFGLSTVMARAAHLKNTPFNAQLSLAEDYELWTRLVASGVQAANLPQSLVRYRLHASQASRHQGQRLDQVSRKVRALYCARLLGDVNWVNRLANGHVEEVDLLRASELVKAFLADAAHLKPHDFRFLYAWLYQMQPSHGLMAWWRWHKLQRALGLMLDGNYRFNIFLLALLGLRYESPSFDQLIKLKR